MCKYIFFLHNYIPTYLMTQCADPLFLEVALFDTQWRRDVSLKMTAGIKQTNISKNGTGLNGFTAEQLLYAVKYKCHCHLMVDVVNKQPVI